MKKLWDPKTLAEHLGISVSWIYDRTRQQGPEMIPHVKLGKYLRFDPESTAFRSWLQSHEKGSVVGLPTQRRLQVVENKE